MCVFSEDPFSHTPPLHPPTHPNTHAQQLPDDPRLHQCVAAYMSDADLMSTSLRPHGRSLYTGDVQNASVDHAMWFHHPFRADDYLLYTMRSPQTANALGTNFGQFFDQSGKHVISIAQEGLIRPVQQRHADRPDRGEARAGSLFRSSTQRAPYARL